VLQSGVDLPTWVREALSQGPHWWREVATWPDDRREQWEERACIMETDGALSRSDAEREAFRLMADL
jgi:hypothetical protein